ncbi:hypothetical protein GQX73_g10493 [Xylaria multiplex]|uniref:Uncharacterized protein n=1 Tax=Xylaria multiplex TaxID=323545 RepID=A0A7C8IPB0_9PEZI|nr:hypothetical protein GQX73_g10493 [Xylaria multiplex]
MLVAILQKALTKIRASLSGYSLNHEIWKLTHGRRLRDAALGSASSTASETSSIALDENPIVEFIPSKIIPSNEEHDDLPRGRSLDNLPPEILIKMWKYVAETPSWFHVNYNGGKIHAANISGHREHWVNRGWYFADEFRASLSRHPVQEIMHRYAAKVLDTTLLFRGVYRHGVYRPLEQTASI